jgi:putative nucleotidyltransferase with HDIG domain
MLNRRIASLREAVARIGQRELASVVVRVCAGPMLDRGLPAYALPRRVAWRHAATVSTGARQLAAMVGVGTSDEASVAGLLHDVGKVVFASVVPELAARAVAIARGRSVPVWQAEREVLGFDHAEVGAALLRSWALPAAVSEAVRWHHRPRESGSALATVVSLADAAAHVVGAVGGGGACPQPAWDDEAAAALGARPEHIAAFLQTLRCVEEGEPVNLS